LDTVGNDIWTGIFDQEMNVIARDDVVKYLKAKALLRLKKPAQIRAAIAPNLQKETFSMASGV
jgi:hypothetical protein